MNIKNANYILQGERRLLLSYNFEPDNTFSSHIAFNWVIFFENSASKIFRSV